MKSIEQQLFDYDALEQTHDLSLPDWGPYSSRTFGLSHIHSKEYGNIVDVVLMGGFYRRPLAVPDARRPSGGIPWKCSKDLRYYSYRQQIEWKDKVVINTVSNGEHKVEFYGIMEDEENLHLFDIVFNSEEGQELGVINKEGEEISISVVSYAFEQDENWTAENREMIYSMQEDMNFIFDYLRKEQSF